MSEPLATGPRPVQSTYSWDVTFVEYVFIWIEHMTLRLLMSCFIRWAEHMAEDRKPPRPQETLNFECLIQNYHIHQALIRRAAKLSVNALRNTRGLLIETQTQKELYWLKSPPITCCCFCSCSVCNVDPVWMSMSVSLCVFDFFVFLRLRFFTFIEAVIEGYDVWMHDCGHYINTLETKQQFISTSV